MYEDKNQNIVKTIADFLGITSHIYTECRVVQSCVSDGFESKNANISYSSFQYLSVATVFDHQSYIHVDRRNPHHTSTTN